MYCNFLDLSPCHVTTPLFQARQAVNVERLESILPTPTLTWLMTSVIKYMYFCKRQVFETWVIGGQRISRQKLYFDTLTFALFEAYLSVWNV